ncbi:hypothetical protein MRX96_009945 [Rhipicephalus microplus]
MRITGRTTASAFESAGRRCRTRLASVRNALAAPSDLPRAARGRRHPKSAEQAASVNLKDAKKRSRRADCFLRDNPRVCTSVTAGAKRMDTAVQSSCLLAEPQLLGVSSRRVTFDVEEAAPGLPRRNAVIVRAGGRQRWRTGDGRRNLLAPRVGQRRGNVPGPHRSNAKKGDPPPPRTIWESAARNKGRLLVRGPHDDGGARFARRFFSPCLAAAAILVSPFPLFSLFTSSPLKAVCIIALGSQGAQDDCAGFEVDAFNPRVQTPS